MVAGTENKFFIFFFAKHSVKYNSYVDSDIVYSAQHILILLQAVGFFVIKLVSRCYFIP